jgi:hypothetical protein
VFGSPGPILLPITGRAGIVAGFFLILAISLPIFRIGNVESFYIRVLVKRSEGSSRNVETGKRSMNCQACHFRFMFQINADVICEGFETSFLLILALLKLGGFAGGGGVFDLFSGVNAIIKLLEVVICDVDGGVAREPIRHKDKSVLKMRGHLNKFTLTRWCVGYGCRSPCRLLAGLTVLLSAIRHAMSLAFGSSHITINGVVGTRCRNTAFPRWVGSLGLCFREFGEPVGGPTRGKRARSVDVLRGGRRWVV